MTQQFFVSKDRTIRGPVTDRKRVVNPRDGKVVFSGTPGKVYRSHDDKGNPIALPAGFIAYAKDKKETNGHTLLENLIADGSIVFEPGGQSPVQFARPMSVDLIAKEGVVTEDKDPKAATK